MHKMRKKKLHQRRSQERIIQVIQNVQSLHLVYIIGLDTDNRRSGNRTPILPYQADPIKYIGSLTAIFPDQMAKTKRSAVHLRKDGGIK